jgi:hypothetical protein
VAGLALTHTIGTAVIKGLFTNGEPFFRTPKTGESQRLLHALGAAREEILLMIGLWLSAWGVSRLTVNEGPDRLAWIVVLLVQSVPYVSSVLASLASAFPLPARMLGIGYRPLPTTVQRPVEAVTAERPRNRRRARRATS